MGLSNDWFIAVEQDGRITSLRHTRDAFPTEYILPGQQLGTVDVTCRPAGKADWRTAAQGLLDVSSSFELNGNALVWNVVLRNTTPRSLELGDLGLGFPMHTKFVWDAAETANLRVFRHGIIAGHNSFLFWMRPNTIGPYLTMAPLGETKFEYWRTTPTPGDGEGRFVAYIHSKAQAEEIRRQKGSWRQAHTGVVLAPRGQDGDRIRHAVKFWWAAGYQAIRDGLVENGQIDVEVVPGMTLPIDMKALVSLRTRLPIREVVPEFSAQTVVEDLGLRPGSRHLFRVRFCRLGENLLTVRYGDGRQMVLEFFATEPVETLIRKRAAFLINACQHRDPACWYRGLISDFNLESGVLLSPEHLDRIEGWREYMASCDDPGLGKAPFVALKNIEYPAADEIAALDEYIEHFVWGGLQQTEAEPFPYGIYGIPNWKRNRESDDPGPKGRQHIWRIYDYPHITLLYFAMYRIAKLYPRISMRRTATEYLKRAAGTAKALFTIPMATKKWSAYATGLYNELVISELIPALEDEGLKRDADDVRAHWDCKTRTFICENPNLFGSEYPFDSTGFESMHALAIYALSESRRPGSTLNIPPETIRAFIEKEIAGNICCRGWLEAAYYLLGSDFRGCGSSAYLLSYMAQMGGWALLDYALYHAADPFPYLRLGYASFLSSWALMNSGTAESNYGYWFPGARNDGGAGGGFEPAAYGRTWLDQPHGRGSWYYGCEIDLGFSGGLRCARTVLADDPIFGLFCFGGSLCETPEGFEALPRDGVRRNLHAIRQDRRLHVILDRDGFAGGKPITIARDLRGLRFLLENRSGEPHQTEFRVGGLAGLDCHVRDLRGNSVKALARDEATVTFRLEVPREGAGVELRLA